MDKTSITVVTICVLIMGWWLYEQQKFQQQQALLAPAPVVQTTAAGPAGAPGVAVVVPVMPFDTNLPERTLTLTNRNVPIHVHFARGRAEDGGAAGLPREDFPALEKGDGHGHERGGVAERPRGDSDAGDFGVRNWWGTAISR